MRRIRRTSLSGATVRALRRIQARVNQLRNADGFDATDAWASTRKSLPIRACLSVLHAMAGNRQRCMYCSDSHGSDIEHFWPKTRYPERLFRWDNMLLCCTECGRFKGSQFPLKGEQPLLLNPTEQDPWIDLDFDPATGNIVPSFDAATAQWSERGTATTKVLHLDRREAMAAGYIKTFRRLIHVVERALAQPELNGGQLIADLSDADDHGLLGWCFRGSGRTVAPFNTLRQQYPEVWEFCSNELTT